MTHVMQYQHGVSVFWRGLALHAAKYLTLLRYDPYNVEPYDPARPFRSYNIEQQGDIASELYYDTTRPNKKRVNNIETLRGFVWVM
jgi:hypothetical protein